MNSADLKTYRDTVDAMEKAGVSDEYIQGWQGGWLVNPVREEQNTNEAYDAGYEDGSAKNTDNYKGWVGK